MVVVEGPAHGDFKGSPIRFTYRFALETDDGRRTVSFADVAATWAALRADRAQAIDVGPSRRPSPARSSRRSIVPTSATGSGPGWPG